MAAHHGHINYLHEGTVDAAAITTVLGRASAPPILNAFQAIVRHEKSHENIGDSYCRAFAFD